VTGNQFSGGINTVGGDPTFNGPVAGGDMVLEAQAQAQAPGPRRKAEVCVLTVLPTETRAVVAVLRRMNGYRETRLSHGPLGHEAWTRSREGGTVRVAAAEMLDPDITAAALAYRELVEAYRPGIVLLVGIGGGVGRGVGIRDVVISDQVISYDAHKVTPGGTYRRGRSQSVEAVLGYRVKDLMRESGGLHRGPSGQFTVHFGPIGSGSAVVADARSEIRLWLETFNEKVLAVETEAAGVAQAFRHSVAADRSVRGWLTIRGISDTADESKGDDYQDAAATNAAEVMASLLPYLQFG